MSRATTVRDAFLNPGYGPAPESRSVVTEWLENGERVFGHYVGGSWTPGEGDIHQTRCPADGRSLARFRYGTDEDIDQAVAAAEAALPPWQEIGGHGRAGHLYRLARGFRSALATSRWSSRSTTARRSGSHGIWMSRSPPATSIITPDGQNSRRPSSRATSPSA